MKVTLYHGGSHIIEKPEIREPERTLDFGKGFYLTSSERQANLWIKSHLKNNNGGYVNIYDFDYDKAIKSLKIKKFKGADKEWVDFVLSNRLKEGFTHDYDVVIGPVANDKVYTQFTLFEGGIITKETLIKELKTYKLVDQFLFHTQKSLEELKYKGNYPVIL